MCGVRVLIKKYYPITYDKEEYYECIGKTFECRCRAGCGFE